MGTTTYSPLKTIYANEQGDTYETPRPELGHDGDAEPRSLVTQATLGIEEQEWAAACDNGFQMACEGIRVGTPMGTRAPLPMAYNFRQLAKHRIKRAEVEKALGDAEQVY